MADERIRNFFQGVLSKTRAGKIPWEPTAEESNFIAAIGGKFTLSIRAWRMMGVVENYTLSLDENGTVLTTITSEEQGVSRSEMHELYLAARKQALRVDDKIDDALGVLDRL
jgi:hypothetical protein